MAYRHLYLAPLPQFLADVRDGGILAHLEERLLAIGSGAVSEGEREAWRRSLPALADVLRRPAFDGGQVFVELFMPLNNQRCDALLTGRTAEGPTAVVIELKQWTLVHPSHLEDHVFVGGQNRVHPSVQVRDYVDTLRHFHSAFTGPGEPIRLHGAAWLHDLDPKAANALRDPRFGGVHLDHPLYCRGEEAAFADWLAARLVPGPGLPTAERIRAGRPLPSPKLLDLVVETVKGTHHWRLLDQQKTVHFAIRHAVVTARESGQKAVLVVRGGPGTGKSVLAIQLLADAARMGWAVAHATGTKAFQTVLQGTTMEFAERLLKSIHNVRTKKALPVKHLFTTFSEIARAGVQTPDALDLTVCDEAHRLWEFRQSKYGTFVKRLSERPMVQELIEASRVTAFFLDDNQSVRPGEIGHSDLIVEHATAMGIPVQRLELEAQYRCAGSESYVRWVDGVLGLREGLDTGWRDHEVYDARLWTDIASLDAHLRSLRARGQRCRLVAGFCWRWHEPDGLGRLPHDVRDPRFGGWSRPWIEKGAQDASPLEHRYYRWATKEDEAYYEQVGSIYAAQGFEFDAVGVIWGDDLVRRGGHWVAQLDRNYDVAFKQEIRRSGEDPVAKLLNVYRVLLTRGMRETHLLVLDDETRAYLKGCLEHRQPAALAVGAREERPVSTRRAAHLQVVAPDGRVRFAPRGVAPRATDPWADGVPVLDLAAAAGGFGAERPDPGDLLEAEEWITWDGAPSFRPGMFVARIRGRSMLPLVADGAWCLFRLASVAEVGARPVLVRRAGDGHEASRFTLKDVETRWTACEDGCEEGARQLAALVLRPRNPAYPVERIEGERLATVEVVAELVDVLGA